MAKLKLTIDSILGGISPALFNSGPGQYSAGLGIDPDKTLTGAAVKTSGALVPSAYTEFSSTVLTSAVNWLITNPVDSNIYALCTNGRFLSYSSVFGSETLVGTISPAAGNGAAYYNNYIYLAGTTNISRYGPLDNSPALTDSVWTGATLGSQAALGNATYPTLRGVVLPSHPMHVHADNKLYVGDFETADNANQGRGKIHWIRTNQGTEEGDTDNGTTQNAFYLPYGYAPVDIESWGTDLVIAAIPMSVAGSNNTITSGGAMLFFWDAVNSPSLPYKAVALTDPLVTALFNHNGNLFVFSGNANNGVQVSIYEGAYSTRQVAFLEEGVSPCAGAVDGIGERVAFGAFTTYPENSASVFAVGSKNAAMPFALHNIINTSAADTASAMMVTALKSVQHANLKDTRFIVAWKDKDSATTHSNFGIENYDNSAADTAVWRSAVFPIGEPFRVNKVSIPLGRAVTTNMTLIPTVGRDDYSSTTALTTINDTNYANSERRIVYFPDVQGLNNLQLQLRWTGTAILSVTFPIIIEVETLTDASG